MKKLSIRGSKAGGVYENPMERKLTARATNYNQSDDGFHGESYVFAPSSGVCFASKDNWRARANNKPRTVTRTRLY